LAAIYAAAAPNTIKRLVLLASPVCFASGENSFRDALISLVPERVPDRAPYPGSLLSQTSVAASPQTFVWSRLLDASLSFGDKEAMNVHARIERWFLDEVPLAGKLTSEIVDLLYRENQFCRGNLKIGDHIIGPADISVPVLAVVNSTDAIAPLESVSPVADVSTEVQIVECPAETGVSLAHLAILVGRQAHAQIWPKIVDWILADAAATERGAAAV
jgi:polyhydroxyalkanoate synthase subunit PhaC